MKKQTGAAVPKTAAPKPPDVAPALAWLKQNSSRSVRDGMTRYGLPADKALGVSVSNIQKLARQLGRDQSLAEALWTTDIYEARLLAAFVGEPGRIAPAVMDRWCRDFDNWGVVDTVCFKFFDQTPHAWHKIEPWARMPGEFQRRAGVVLLACLAGHDEHAADEKFLHHLPLLTRIAKDERNFVKKGVSWALRMIGRRSPQLRTKAVASARKWADSSIASVRWIGRDVLRDLNKR